MGAGLTQSNGDEEAGHLGLLEAVPAGSHRSQTFTTRGIGLAEVPAYVREVWRRRDFIVALARSQLKASNMNTALGQLWTILNPALLALVYYILLAILRGQEERSTAERFTLLISCLFLFFFSRNAVSQGASSVIGNSRLMLNSSFPRAMLPMSAVYKALLDLLFSLAVYAVLHVVTGRPIDVGLAFFPVFIALHGVFNFGVAMFFAVAMVYFRDTANLLGFLIRIWLYMTPVLYPTDLLTDTVKAFLVWNPLYPFFAAYQQMLLGDMPSPVYLACSAAWAAVCLLGGGAIFLARERQLAIRL